MEDFPPAQLLSDSKNIPSSSSTSSLSAKEFDEFMKLQALNLSMKPSSYTSTNTTETTSTINIFIDAPKERHRGQLLHQCLPISCMKIFDGHILVMSEGPCLLLYNPKNSYKEKAGEEKCKRIQIFPNHLTITGFEFVDDSCGYHSRVSPWNGEGIEHHSLAFVWAGNHGIFVVMNRQTLQIAQAGTFPINKDAYLALNYIPIAARWFEHGRILVLLSVFNYIVIYERLSTQDGIQNLKEIGKYECEQENLYSGTMDGEELDELIVFSGTTFKGILVWDIKDGKVNIRHKLMGHKGIPFSLEYSSDWKMLLSASDDRTVIAWAFINEMEESISTDVPVPKAFEIDDSFLMARKSEKFQCIPPVAQLIHRLRGHEARVWKAIWVRRAQFGLIVSVGEDSWVRMTSFDRTTGKFFKAHDGASIYQCGYDEVADNLYTAAHDGSIFQWHRFYLRTQPGIIPFDVITRHPKTDGMYRANQFNRSIYNKDYPRGIVMWNANFIMASMNNGRIIAFHYYDKKQFHLVYDERFKGYSVMSVSPVYGRVAVGGLKGDFVILNIQIQENPELDSHHMFAQVGFYFKFESKILNIIWLADYQVFIVCLEKVYVLDLKVENNRLSGEVLSTFTLNLERPGIPSALLINSKFIIGGDESGSLMLFHIGITGKDLDLLQTIKHVHAEGVTSIVEYKSKIMTGGKFGGVKSFVLEGEGSEARLIKVHEFATPFEWIGKMLVIEDPRTGQEDLLIGGFHKKDFIMYSWNEKRILNEISDVGGGHRRWDFKYGDCDGNASFAFIRDKEIYHSFTFIQDKANNVLKPGLHHKTVNCGITLLKREDNIFIATGSDDGSIRIFRYDLHRNNYFPIHKISCHASSIRALTSMKIDDDRCLLFSGGGRSEIYASLVGLGIEELEVYGKITLIKPKNRETEIDTRVMDLAVTQFQNQQGQNTIVIFCACSDGSVRALIFSLEKKKFAIVSLFNANSHSVMKIEFIQRENVIIVFGVTSNGCLLIWKWKSPENVDFSFHAEPEMIQPIYSKRIRKAAVMSVKIISNVDKFGEYFMAVGSDDCCLSLWKLRISEDEALIKDIDVVELWHEDQAQRGSVIGVEIFDNLVFSCSNDQVIAKFDMEGNLIGKCFAGVPDCQGFIVSHLDDCITCFGDGVTWISIP